MTQHAGLHTDKAAVGLEIALCQIEDIANLRVVEVMENTATHHDVGIGERRVFFAGRRCTCHKGSAFTKPPACEFDVGLGNIDAYVFNIWQHIEHVPGAATDVHNLLAGFRTQMLVNKPVPALSRTDCVLKGAVEPG